MSTGGEPGETGGDRGRPEVGGDEMKKKEKEKEKKKRRKNSINKLIYVRFDRIINIFEMVPSVTIRW